MNATRTALTLAFACSLSGCYRSVALDTASLYQFDRFDGARGDILTIKAAGRERVAFSKETKLRLVTSSGADSTSRYRTIDVSGVDLRAVREDGTRLHLGLGQIEAAEVLVYSPGRTATAIVVPIVVGAGGAALIGVGLVESFKGLGNGIHWRL